MRKGRRWLLQRGGWLVTGAAKLSGGVGNLRERGRERGSYIGQSGG